MAPLTDERNLTEPISAETLAHFHAIPWAHELLQSPLWKPFEIWSRAPKPSLNEDLYIGSTLASADTLPHGLMLYRTDLTQLKLLFHVRPGVAGYSNILHGGATATLIDEYTGCLISLPKHLPGGVEGLSPEQRATWEENTGAATRAWDQTLTAKLEVEYKRPSRLPGDFCLTVSFAGREGRKIFMRGVWEDGEGKVMATGLATYVGVQSTKL